MTIRANTVPSGSGTMHSGRAQYHDPRHEPRASALSRVGHDEPGLVMTDHMIVLSLMLAAFWVLDPFQVNLDRIAVVKHFPLLTLLATLTFAGIGARLFPRAAPGVRWGELGSMLWPLALFAFAVTTGSLIARFNLRIGNTFLNMGLFLLVIPLLARVMCSLTDPARFARNFFLAVGVVAACVGLLEWANYGKKGYFHGAEFIVVPIATYMWFARIPVVLKILGVGLFLSFGVAVHKNTGYLVMLFTLSYCIFWTLRARYRLLSELRVRERFVAFSLFAALGLSALLATFFLVRDMIAPDGNLQYRFHTYERAYTKFLESPVFGTVFTGAATERFELFDVMASVSNVLPTHSDPLDILAHGGVIFSLLFAYGVWKLFRIMSWAADAAPNSSAKQCLPGLHACTAVFLSGLLTMSFNPVMTQPNSALMLWTTTGIGLGLALYVKNSSRILG
jgi:hypothetical protein